MTHRRGLLAILLIVSLVAGGLAWRQSLGNEERRLRDVATRVALEADATRRTDPVRAMLLSVAAYGIAPVAEARTALMSSLAQQELRAFIDPHVANVGRALSMDGRVLVSAGDNRVTTYDTQTGAQIGAFEGIGDGQFRVALSPDGQTLALAREGRIWLWDLRTRRMLGEGSYGDSVAGMPDDLRFTPGGGYLIVDANGETPAAGLWNVRTRSALIPVFDWRFGWMTVAPGDRFLIAGDNSGGNPPQVLSLPEAKAIDDRKIDGEVIAVSPDGLTAVVAERSRLTLWNLSTGKRSKRVLSGTASQAAFSDDGDLLVTVSTSSVTLWRVADGARLMVVKPDAAIAAPPRFGPGNRELVLLDATGQATTYDIRRPDTSDEATSVPKRFSAVSPDGRLLAKDEFESVTVWDSTSKRKIADFSQEDQAYWDSSYGFSPDNRYLAGGYCGEGWDLLDCSLAVYDLVRRTRIMAVNELVAGEHFTFSADGRLLIVAGYRGVEVIDLANRRVLPRSTGPGTRAKSWVALAHSERLAAAPRADRSVGLWDSRSWHPVGRVLRLAAEPRSASFSPDDSTLAVSGADHVTLFDVATGRPLGPRFRTSAALAEVLDATSTAAFSPDGTELRTWGHDGARRTIPLSPGKVILAVCSRAGRTLTEAEWRDRIGPDITYRKLC